MRIKLTRSLAVRGVALITVLMLLVVLLILGMAFLTQQLHMHRTGSHAAQALVARSVAEAGLENARTKLEKDQNFPPITDPEQKTFTYAETLTDLAGTDVVGRYVVTIDISAKKINKIVKVTSLGVVGDKAAIRCTLYCEFDVSGDIASNPNFFRIIHLEDRGGL